MNSVYAEIVHFEFVNWLPILEVCVMQNYLPDNILDISMNYFLWKGDMKKSAELARVLRFWKNKGLNDEGIQRKFIPLKDLVREFTLIEDGDKMRTVFTKSINEQIFNYNSSYFYSGLKSLYYNGYLEKIILLRIYYSRSLLDYKQIWELGIRKLKNFTPYNPGIYQEWINVYFAAVNKNCSDRDLFTHIVPVNPSLIERRRDLFLVIGFNQTNGCIQNMILFKQRAESKLPLVIWRNEILVN